MLSKLMKPLFRNKNLYKMRNNMSLVNKQFVETKRKIFTMQQVKDELIKLMGVEAGYKPLPANHEYLLKYLPKSQKELEPRHMQDSFSEAIVPLGSDMVLQDKYVTFLGNLRLGRLMEDLDMFAVWVSSRHIVFPNHEAGTPIPYVLVTVLVDQINFTDLVPRHYADIRLSGHVSWVGRSSIETVVWIEQDVNGQWLKLTRAIFLMAARNSINTASTFVNPLVATTDYEQHILEGGEGRNLRRKRLASARLLKNVPSEVEQRVIHELFLKTVDLNDPSLSKRQLPPNSGFMRDAVLSSIVFSHPENRNLHNKVFGGFLMRQAFELSWTQAYLYSKVRPKILHIADIGFFKAVDVGSMLQMHSRVVYTEANYLMILVHAQILDPEGELSTTNNFYYVYEMPQAVKKVIPETYHDAVLFLDGRRRFMHVMGLVEGSPREDSLQKPQAPNHEEKKPM